MENAFYMADRFNKILERVAGKSLFDIEEDGTITTTVHTGRTVEAFRLYVEFHDDDNVVITTCSFLGVEEQYFDRIKTLLKSINEVVKYGVFFVNEDIVIAFSAKCGLDLISSMDNPFDFVFCGCETFERYTESIFKVLSGSTIFCLTIPVME